MNFLSRGGASTKENAASRKAAIKHFEAGSLRAKREEIRRLREALKLEKARLRGACRTDRKVAYAGKREVLERTDATIAQARAERTTARESLKANLARLSEVCNIRINRAVGDLSKTIDTLAAELRSGALSARHASERERERPKASAKETQQEATERALRDVEALDPTLVELVRRQRIRPRERQTLSEAYLEWIQENPGAVAEYRAKSSSSTSAADLMCAQAIHAGRVEGDDEARQWAAVHCRENGTATPETRRKLSPAERTIDWIEGGLRVPKAAPVVAVEKKPRRGKKAPREQTGLGIGKFGAEFINANQQQRVLGDVPF